MAQASQDTDTPRGLAFAVLAYFLWGFLPLYMKLLDHVPAFEIVAHRIVWSVPVAALVLIVLRRTRDIRAALRSPRMLAVGALTATLITVNWCIYVWAVTSGHAIEAALGYYINPLFSILLGTVLLGERMGRTQMLAIGLAVAAVALLTWEAGQLPLVALGLTVSWGAYALCKKRLPIGPNQGFLLEVLILSGPALSYLVWQGQTGQGAFGMTARDTWLLAGCGIVTAVPLMFYANGAPLIRLSTAGILQYIAPTMIFLCAVFAFGEPFEGARLIAFPMIWAALAIYSVPMIRQMRAQ